MDGQSMAAVGLPGTRAAAAGGPRRGRSLATGVVDALTEAIRAGRLAPGDRLPTESALGAQHGVSRTVVREAISRLQAAGRVETRHGIGTFVLGAGEGEVFRVRPDELATLGDVLEVLELRIAVETEAAALAAQRRGSEHLARMRAALRDFEAAIEAGRDGVDADLAFHREVARATGNARFEGLLAALGRSAIPRARLPGGAASAAVAIERTAYLRRVNEEHASVLEAIAAGDADAARAAMRTHLANSRERRRRAAGLPRR